MFLILMMQKIYKNFKKKFKSLDVLICNVGLSSIRNKKLSEEVIWKKMFENNLLSAVNLVSSFKNDLIKNKGKIIFISSIASKNI